MTTMTPPVGAPAAVTLAAVATLFSLSVVEPMMVSPCGAGFFVIRDGRTGEVVTLDNYATVPGKARPEPPDDPAPRSNVSAPRRDDMARSADAARLARLPTHTAAGIGVG